MAVTRTAKGTASLKTAGTTLTLANVAISNDSLLVVALAYDDVVLDSVTWGSQVLELGEAVLGAGVRTRIAYGWVVTGATNTITATWASSLTSKAMTANQFTSGLAGVQAIKQTPATLTGTGTAASTGNITTATSGDRIIVGVVGTEGPSGDTAGTWVRPTTAGQRVGTTGNPANSNVTVSDAYTLAPGSVTNGLSKTGMTSRDWGATYTEFRWETPPTTVGGSFTADSILRRIESATLTSDAILKRTETATFTADAVLDAGTGLTTYASDTFTRTETDTWGTADTGGAWTIKEGSAGEFDVTGSAGTIICGGVFQGKQIALDSVSAQDVDMTVRVQSNKLATGTDAYVAAWLQGRRISGQDTRYQGFVRALVDGTPQIRISRVVAGVSTELVTWTTIPGSFAAASYWWIRFQVEGTSPTTLRVKAWPDGGAEPSSWQGTTTDSSAALQAAGAVGVQVFNSPGITNNPVIYDVDDFLVTSIADGPDVVSGNFTADAILKGTILGSATADSVLRKGVTATVTADSILRRIESGSVTADAFFKRVESATVTADAVIKRTESATLTADAVIVIGTTGGSFTANAVLKATIPATTTANAILRRVEGGSVTANAIVRRVESQSFTANSILLSRIELTFAASAITKRVESGTFAANGIIKRNESASVTADSILRRTESQTVAANAMLRFIGQANFSAAAFLKAVVAGSLTADSVLKKTQPGSFTADSILFKVTSSSATADAVLRTNVEQTFTAAAWISSGAEIIKGFEADAILKKTQAGTFTSDAHLVSRITGNFTADSVLRSEALGSITADAYLLQVSGHSFDANAVLRGSTSLSVDADAVLRRVESQTFAANAVLVVILGNTFTADAVLSGPVSGSTSADAILRKAETNSATADAILQRIEGGTFSADAYLNATTTYQFNADAVILKTIVNSFGADAWISSGIGDPFAVTSDVDHSLVVVSSAELPEVSTISVRSKVEKTIVISTKSERI
jgi:hypothetical protein